MGFAEERRAEDFLSPRPDEPLLCPPDRMKNPAKSDESQHFLAICFLSSRLDDSRPEKVLLADRDIRQACLPDSPVSEVARRIACCARQEACGLTVPSLPPFIVDRGEHCTALRKPVARKGFRVGRHDDHMPVIGHQQIAPDLDARLVRGCGRQVAVERLAVLLEEGPLAPVAALGDVIGEA